MRVQPNVSGQDPEDTQSVPEHNTSASSEGDKKGDKEGIVKAR